MLTENECKQIGDSVVCGDLDTVSFLKTTRLKELLKAERERYVILASAINVVQNYNMGEFDLRIHDLQEVIAQCSKPEEATDE